MPHVVPTLVDVSPAAIPSALRIVPNTAPIGSSEVVPLVTSHAQDHLLARGLWLTPWYFRNRRWFFTIDSRGHVINLEPVTDDPEALDRQVAGMWDALWQFDPTGPRGVD